MDIKILDFLQGHGGAYRGKGMEGLCREPCMVRATKPKCNNFKAYSVTTKQPYFQRSDNFCPKNVQNVQAIFVTKYALIQFFGFTKKFGCRSDNFSVFWQLFMVTIVTIMWFFPFYLSAQIKMSKKMSSPTTRVGKSRRNPLKIAPTSIFAKMSKTALS